MVNIIVLCRAQSVVLVPKQLYMVYDMIRGADKQPNNWPVSTPK